MGRSEGPAADAMDHIELGSPAFRSASRALFAVGVATFAVLYCVQPLQPVFSREFGVSAAESSLSLSLTTGLLAPMLLVASSVSDTIGRKRVLLWSIFASAGLTAIAACAPDWTTLLCVRLLTAVTLSGLQAVAMAYIGEEVAPRAVGYAMGLFVSGSSLGGLAGRLLSGFVGGAASWRIAIAAIAVLAAAAGLYVWRALPESRHFRPASPRIGSRLLSLRTHLGDRRLRALFAVAFLSMGAFVAVYSLVGYRLLAPPFGLTQSVVGAIFLIYLVGTLSSGTAGRLSDRIGRRRVMLAGLATGLLGLALTMATTLWIVVPGLAIFTAGFFAVHATASGWISHHATVARGQASALYLFAFYMGSSLLASAIALLWPLGGWPAVTLAAAILLVLAMAVTNWGTG